MKNDVKLHFRHGKMPTIHWGGGVDYQIAYIEGIYIGTVCIFSIISKCYFGASLVDQPVKNLSAMQET